MTTPHELLEDFDAIIVDRGEAYYRDGRVLDMMETSPGEYRATVEGSDDYTVFVSLHDDGECRFECDCPYSNAPFCKHVVAVLLAIEAQQRDPATPPCPKSSTKDTSLASSLNSLSKKQLASLLLALTKSFPETEDWLNARLSSPKDALNAYRRLIRQTAASYTKHSYIDYRDMYEALRGAESAVDHLEEMIEFADPLHAMDFCFMIIKETMEIMQDGDDSDGAAGCVIEGCLEQLEILMLQRVMPSDGLVLRKCFERLLQTSQSSLFRGWDDWKDRLITQCVQIADILPALRENLLQYQLQELNSAEQKEGYAREYAWNSAQQTYYEMLLRWNGEEAALAFAATHMENDFFRVQFFERYVRQRRYDQALKLCLEAEQASGSYYGLQSAWRQRRFVVYTETGDVEAQKGLAESLLMDGHEAYYGRLKALYSPEDWIEKRDELLHQLSKRKLHIYEQIIVKEDDKPRLIAYVQENPLSVFSLYEHLLPDYSAEIKDTFFAVLRTLASAASDRKAYQGVCKQIRILGKACGKDAAREVILELQQNYPRRPALQDELQKLLSRF